jgi:hypothetical protein
MLHRNTLDAVLNEKFRGKPSLGSHVEGANLESTGMTSICSFMDSPGEVLEVGSVGMAIS